MAHGCKTPCFSPSRRQAATMYTVCPGAKRLGFPYNDNAHVRMRLVSNEESVVLLAHTTCADSVRRERALLIKIVGGDGRGCA